MMVLCIILVYWVWWCRYRLGVDTRAVQSVVTRNNCESEQFEILFIPSNLSTRRFFASLVRKLSVRWLQMQHLCHTIFYFY
ncbi:hypothetical protein BDQ94DRAFT_139372 [Aspergillus welwitschiae]|uniref:Secreted protein n=1 Tax=Aspergillus welwitschiae TaxID=1341132 RepID=A0A3F3Q9J5_9EURO|nr:hypothetical protein BDQ94DRAFT_139372 [Aspergillus welwitschiae]RDH35871.1 hypothetical protein BDQ94DRAFT_139372 [Aspergillus welwitschiae]